MDIARTVLLRMTELGITRAGLARQLDGKVKQRTLYDFLTNGKLNAESLGHVLDALGLGIYPQEQVSQPTYEQRVKETEAAIDAAKTEPLPDRRDERAKRRIHPMRRPQ